MPDLHGLPYSGYVEIVEFESGEVVRRIPCGSSHSAQKVDRGVNINLNHERFYTRIVEDDKRFT